MRGKIAADGVKHYFGKVCAKHPELSGKRYRSTRNCCTCQQEHKVKWEENDPLRVLELRREGAKRRRRANPQKFRERDRQRPRRYSSPEEQRKRCALRRARKAGATRLLTAIERARLQEFYDIAAARTAQTGEQWHVDHDKPLARGGLHHPDNLVLLPADVNIAKGARFDSTIDFLLS